MMARHGFVFIVEHPPLARAPCIFLALVVSDDSGLPKGLLKNLLKTVNGVPSPLLVTITTEKDTVLFANLPMRSLSASDRANLYMLLNDCLIEELAWWAG